MALPQARLGLLVVLALAIATRCHQCPNTSFTLSTSRGRPEHIVPGEGEVYFEDANSLFRGRKTIEIGGPSAQFRTLYTAVTGNQNFSDLFTNVVYPLAPSSAPKDGDAFLGPDGEILGLCLRRHGAYLHGMKNESFGMVFSSHSLEHFIDPIGALLEWHRVLKPGGLMMLVLPFAPQTFDADRGVSFAQELLFLHDEKVGFSETELTSRAHRYLQLRRPEWIGPEGLYATTPEFRRAHVFSRCPSVRLDSLFSVDGREKSEELLKAQALCDEMGDTDMLVMESKVHWHVFDFNLLNELVEGCLGYRTLWRSFQPPFHQVFLAQKPS